MKTHYAVHSHIGVYWDGGVRLVGIYRFYVVARIALWWHVVLVNPWRRGTVVPVVGTQHVDFIESSREWQRIYAMMDKNSDEARAAISSTQERQSR